MSLMGILDSIFWAKNGFFFNLPVSLCSLHCLVLLAFLFDPAKKEIHLKLQQFQHKVQLGA